jgi:hypothetical protein
VITLAFQLFFGNFSRIKAYPSFSASTILLFLLTRARIGAHITPSTLLFQTNHYYYRTMSSPAIRAAQAALASVDLSSYDPEQSKLMDEKCILVDEDDNAIGAMDKKTCKQLLQPLFLKVHNFVSNHKVILWKISTKACFIVHSQHLCSDLLTVICSCSKEHRRKSHFLICGPTPVALILSPTLNSRKLRRIN